MKITSYILILSIACFSIHSCKPVEKDSTVQILNIAMKFESDATDTLDCDYYFKKHKEKRNLKDELLKGLITNKTIELGTDNLNFLKVLKQEKWEGLVIENVLFPIFRLSKDEIGIYAFPDFKMQGNFMVPDSPEMDLIELYEEVDVRPYDYRAAPTMYPQVLNEKFKGTNKPTFFFYTMTEQKRTDIKDIGSFWGECLEYFLYTIDTTNISINDKVLFGSSIKIDLVYETNARLDSLMQNDPLNGCVDCPHSGKLRKTFARVKGTDNLYFAYADTFPINNEVDTPLRSLVMLVDDTNYITLWRSSIDLFGCACL